MWPSVRQELLAMRSSLPLLFSPLTRKPLTVVGAADASGCSDQSFGGIGLGICRPPDKDIVSVLQMSKQSGRNGLKQKQCKLLGKKQQEGTPFLTFVFPMEWVNGTVDWKELLCYAPKYPQHIDELEFRGQLLVYELAAKLPQLAHSLFMVLCDNTVVCSIIAKGRSRVFRLNALCKRKLGLELISDIVLLPGYVESAWQPMDLASRDLILHGSATAISDHSFSTSTDLVRAKSSAVASMAAAACKQKHAKNLSEAGQTIHSVVQTQQLGDPGLGRPRRNIGDVSNHLSIVQIPDQQSVCRHHLGNSQSTQKTAVDGGGYGWSGHSTA